VIFLTALSALLPTADACSIATEHVEHFHPAAGSADAPSDAVIRLALSGVVVDDTDDYGVEVWIGEEQLTGAIDKSWPQAWGGGGFVTFTPDDALPEGATVTVRYRDSWYSDDPESTTEVTFTVGGGSSPAPETPALTVFDFSENHTRNPDDGSCEVEWSRHIELAVEAPDDLLGVVFIWRTDEDGEILDEQPYFVLEQDSYYDYDDVGFSWFADEADPDEICLAAAYENAAGESSALSDPVCQRVRREIFGCSAVPMGAFPALLLPLLGLLTRRRRA